MKIKIVTPDSLHAQLWAAALSSGGSFKVGTVVQPLHTVNVLVNGSRPDLVVVEVLSPRDFEALETLAGAHPEIDYVLVGTDLNSELLMRAMRAGVREVLPAPASADAQHPTMAPASPAAAAPARVTPSGGIANATSPTSNPVAPP